MKIIVIDYGAGNVYSVVKAFEKVAFDLNSKSSVILTNKADDILSASHVILPGQGKFDDCAHALRKNQEVWQALHDSILHQGKAFLGICVGMQLLASRGLEGQGAEGLGWIKAIVDKIIIDETLKQSNPTGFKIPHMGWNTLRSKGSNHILTDVTGEDVYFAHSWAMKDVSPQYILSTTDYGGNIIAAVGRDNIAGVQFHPEKSQKVGLKIIMNFLQWKV